jgi:hypothetical protein
MFAETLKRDWCGGWALWDWKSKLYAETDAKFDGDYAIFGKPAEKVVRKIFEEKRRDFDDVKN